jgi:hypothetical protein
MGTPGRLLGYGMLAGGVTEWVSANILLAYESPAYKRSCRGCGKPPYPGKGIIAGEQVRSTGYWRDFLFQEQRGFCKYCARKMTMDVEDPLLVCTIDHITPRAEGGHTLVENIVGACRQCNNSRGVIPVPALRPLRAALRAAAVRSRPALRLGTTAAGAGEIYAGAARRRVQRRAAGEARRGDAGQDRGARQPGKRCCIESRHDHLEQSIFELPAYAIIVIAAHCARRKGGRVRFIAPVLKTDGPQGSVGSNPTPSSNLVVWLRG